jgi:uncharacterized protein (DUF433 family)
MTFVVQAEPPPLHTEPDGAIRVGQSRVLLEMVIHAFDNGATPETILQQYPTLSLPDVYAVVAYYLRHPAAVREYLDQRATAATVLRAQVEARQGDLAAIRARLTAARPSRD